MNKIESALVIITCGLLMAWVVVSAMAQRQTAEEIRVLKIAHQRHMEWHEWVRDTGEGVK